MRAQSPTAPVPTEPLLGPWSLTALAALFVAGGILMFVPGKNVAGTESGMSELHPVKGPAEDSSSSGHPAPIKGAKPTPAKSATTGRDAPAVDSGETAPDR